MKHIFPKFFNVYIFQAGYAALELMDNRRNYYSYEKVYAVINDDEIYSENHSSVYRYEETQLCSRKNFSPPKLHSHQPEEL